MLAEQEIMEVQVVEEVIILTDQQVQETHPQLAHPKEILEVQEVIMELIPSQVVAEVGLEEQVAMQEMVMVE